MDLIAEKKDEFDKILDNLQKEFQKLRTSRANPAMVEDLKVNYYNTAMTVKQLASISVPEPRQLLVTPWDKNALAPVEKAIRDSDLGFNPTNEGDKIRVTIPELTEERRRELAKIAGRIAEEARIKLRSMREDLMKEIKKQEEAKVISEDDKFRLHNKLQETVEDYNKKIKELAEAKEKEIMTL
jgi:ribosome recycling factor